MVDLSRKQQAILMAKSIFLALALTAVLLASGPALSGFKGEAFASDADGIGREKEPPLSGLTLQRKVTLLNEGLRVQAEKFSNPQGAIIWRYSHKGNVFAYLIKDPKATPPYRILYKKQRRNTLFEVYLAGTYIVVPDWAE
jgi:hypothetical protein